jgi:hypothetical protein
MVRFLYIVLLGWLPGRPIDDRSVTLDQILLNVNHAVSYGTPVSCSLGDGLASFAQTASPER